MGRGAAPLLPQGDRGERRTGGEGTHLAKASIEAHLWNGKTA